MEHNRSKTETSLLAFSDRLNDADNDGSYFNTSVVAGDVAGMEKLKESSLNITLAKVDNLNKPEYKEYVLRMLAQISFITANMFSFVERDVDSLISLEANESNKDSSISLRDIMIESVFHKCKDDLNQFDSTKDVSSSEIAKLAVFTMLHRIFKAHPSLTISGLLKLMDAESLKPECFESCSTPFECRELAVFTSFLSIRPTIPYGDEDAEGNSAFILAMIEAVEKAKAKDDNEK